MKVTLKRYTTTTFRWYVRIYVLFLMLLGLNIILGFPMLSVEESLMGVLLAVILLFAFVTELIILVSSKLEAGLDAQDLVLIAIRDDYLKNHDRRLVTLEKTRSDYIESKHLIIEHVSDHDHDCEEAREALGNAEALQILKEDRD